MGDRESEKENDMCRCTTTLTQIRDTWVGGGNRTETLTCSRSPSGALLPPAWQPVPPNKTASSRNRLGGCGPSTRLGHGTAAGFSPCPNPTPASMPAQSAGETKKLEVLYHCRALSKEQREGAFLSQAPHQPPRLHRASKTWELLCQCRGQGERRSQVFSFPQSHTSLHACLRRRERQAP